MLHLVGCLYTYYLYQWCTVKQISDNEIYLLIKYIKSVLWRVVKCLSYIQDARCLKVNCRIYGKLKFYYISRNPELGSSRVKVQVTYFSGTSNKTLRVMKRNKKSLRSYGRCIPIHGEDITALVNIWASDSVKFKF